MSVAFYFNQLFEKLNMTDWSTGLGSKIAVASNKQGADFVIVLSPLASNPTRPNDCSNGLVECSSLSQLEGPVLDLEHDGTVEGTKLLGYNKFR